MKKLIFILFVLISSTLSSQTNQYLNFYGWTNGSLSGTMTSDADPLQFGAKTGCITGTVSVALSGGAFINSCPKYNGNGVNGIPSGQFGFLTDVNWTNTSQTVTITIDFRKSGTLIELPIEFDIGDLNAGSCIALSSNRFIDVVSVVGYKANLTTSVLPTSMTSPCVGNSLLSTNQIKGGAGCGGSVGGRVKFNTSNKIARVVITYSSGTGTPADGTCTQSGTAWPLNAGQDPRSQFIAISAIKLNYDCTTNTVLPVTLLSQEVNCENEYPKIEWVTSSETNNDYFTIWKSLNAYDYMEIGTVKGSGNSSTNVSYSWIDDTKNNEKAYYRLSQTDFDGSTKHFSPMFLSACDNENSFTAFFNSNNQLIVDGENIREVSVYNALGQLVLSNLDFNKNEPLTIKQNLTKGIYLIVVKDRFDNLLSQKLLLK